MGGDVVILVVGDENRSKAAVADALAELGGAAEPETTAAGARIFPSGGASGHARAVIDATPLPRAVSEDGALKSARRWISENSLRRLLFRKLVFLVCVVGAAAAAAENEDEDEDEDTEEKEREEEFFWLDALGLIFAEYKGQMKIVVDTARAPGAAASPRIESALGNRGFPTANASFVDLTGFGPAAAKFLLENELTPRPAGEKWTAVAPFLVREVESWDESERLGPWGPERVILFGKSGSGKSTLAQMLTAGRLDAASADFPASSGVRGETRAIARGAGRGWYVVDTPGFGEPRGPQSTVPTREAESQLKRFVKTIEGSYAHFLFVIHRDRIDELEVRLWKFFVLLFGTDIRYHFSVVVSNADSSWVEDNLPHLRDNFKGCSSFLGAEFPSVQTDDEEWEMELQEVRQESLKEIENTLAGLSRNDTVCRLGEYSQTALEGRKVNLYGNNSNGGVPQKVLGVAKRTYFEIYVSLSRLANCLTVNDDIILLPQ